MPSGASFTLFHLWWLFYWCEGYRTLLVASGLQLGTRDSVWGSAGLGSIGLVPGPRRWRAPFSRHV